MLVVEDDEDIAQVLQRSLRMEGYEVKLAGDGEQALDDSSLPARPDDPRPRAAQLDGIEVAQLRSDGDDSRS